jgi:WD40 repeat protein
LITRSQDDKGKLWDAKKGNVLADIGDLSRGYGIGFSPDGTRLVTQEPNALWDARAGKILTDLADSSSFEFSPDGALLATQSAEATTLRNAKSGEKLSRLDN